VSEGVVIQSVIILDIAIDSVANVLTHQETK
jgi:hypothetical protein